MLTNAGLPAGHLLGLVTALGCGLLIGIDRERRKGSGPHRAFAGVRSFALTALIGAFAQILQPALVWLAGLLIVLLSVVSHARDQSDDPGITTELALFLCFLLGVNAPDHPHLSAGAAVVVAIMLNFRQDLHHFSNVSLQASELKDLLILAAAALVALPLLPNEASRWLLGANPHRLWALVIVLMSLQAAGYVALRIKGAQWGLAISGFGSGFVSSTATTAAMGTRYRQEPGLLAACVGGALLSTVATFVLLFIVTMTIAPGLLMALAPTFACALLTAVLMAALSIVRQGKHASYEQPQGRAFNMREAVIFALVLTAATAGVAYANQLLGHTALNIGATLAGLVDVHAAAGSVLSLAASNTISPAACQLTLLLAISSNTGSKIVAAALAGGLPYAMRVGAGLLLVLLAAWLPFLLGWSA